MNHVNNNDDNDDEHKWSSIYGSINSSVLSPDQGE